MINYSTIDVNRGIMHHINPKEEGQEHGTVKYEKTPFAIDDTIKETIRKRLVTAAGKDSRAFELEIGNNSTGTFFDHAKNLKASDEKSFIKASRNIAELLAESQTRNNIPGGVFILLDCTNKKTNTGLYIVIKAELHEALKHTVRGGISKVQVLKDIFLSPSQKLYKIGILYERTDTSKSEPNNAFTCFLFDEQFRIDGSKPAEYFYKDFLGFSIDKNAKIQTARFYDQTYNFIIKNIPTSEQKIALTEALKVDFITNIGTTISPQDFSRNYIQDGMLKDLYNDEVANYLPSTIYKDNTLIQSQLDRKKIFFPNSINITGRAKEFDENVEIISDDKELERLKADNNYTIVRIKGKPFGDA